MSLPLLTTFLKPYSHPFLSLALPTISKLMLATTEPGMLTLDASKVVEIMFLPLGVEAEEDKLIEKEGAHHN